jgi:hypothetical protein
MSGGAIVALICGYERFIRRPTDQVSGKGISKPLSLVDLGTKTGFSTVPGTPVPGTINFVLRVLQYKYSVLRNEYSFVAQNKKVQILLPIYHSNCTFTIGPH